MSQLFASIYDRVMKFEYSTKLFKERKNLLAKAHGRVLEIGSGTGINFPLYKGVESVNAIEPNKYMIERSRTYQKRATVPISVHQQTAESLSFPENTFDSVVCTLVFCTIKDPETALKDIQRVAKPGATLLFLEHVRMDHSFLGKTQDLLNPVWKRIAGGCHLNRNTLTIIQHSGLDVKNVTTFYKGLAIKVICANNK